jgi:hypothetical protein
MRREDWAGKRISEAWLGRFPTCPGASTKIAFVDFLSSEAAVRENQNLRDPSVAILRGRPDAEFPPGDFDPDAGYLIGFTDVVDCGIFVDLRAASGGSIIYHNLSPRDAIHATAFYSIDEFVRFYVEQHGAIR